MLNISKVTEIIDKTMDGQNTPANELPAFGVDAIAQQRPGLSAQKTTAKIIENNKILGIPTGPNDDGSSNKINQYTYNVVKCIFEDICSDAVISAAVPKFSLLIQAQGGNAGGPVVCTGTNMTDTLAKGIIQ